MWMREDYEKAADQIAKDFSAGNGTVSINQLATKIATDASLNPDGIRTLVRLANTNAFQELFAKNAGQPDRMFEFETGDPEIVISNLYTNEKAASVVLPSTSSYDFLADYFGPISTKTAEDMSALEDKGEEDEEEDEDEGEEDEKDSKKKDKESDEESKAPVLNKAEVTNLFDRAKEKLQEEKKAEEIRWGLAVESAANICRDIIGNNSRFNKTAFYRDLLAASDASCYEDLQGIHQFLTGEAKADLFNGEKIATVMDTTAPSLTKEASQILGFLLKARDARYNWCVADNALEKLNGMAY